MLPTTTVYIELQYPLFPHHPVLSSLLFSSCIMSVLIPVGEEFHYRFLFLLFPFGRHETNIWALLYYVGWVSTKNQKWLTWQAFSEHLQLMFKDLLKNRKIRIRHYRKNIIASQSLSQMGRTGSWVVLGPTRLGRG